MTFEGYFSYVGLTVGYMIITVCIPVL